MQKRQVLKTLDDEICRHSTKSNESGCAPVKYVHKKLLRHIETSSFKLSHKQRGLASEERQLLLGVVDGGDRFVSKHESSKAGRAKKNQGLTKYEG